MYIKNTKFLSKFHLRKQSFNNVTRKVKATIKFLIRYKYLLYTIKLKNNNYNKHHRKNLLWTKKNKNNIKKFLKKLKN